MNEAAALASDAAEEIARVGARAVDRCRLLSRPPYSDAADQLWRAYLSPAHRAASARLAEWMKDAGMIVRTDPAANVIGRYEGIGGSTGSGKVDGTVDGKVDGIGAPLLLIGSHIDSVRDAGSFDGPLGIMLGIECVEALRRRGSRMPFAIEVIAFGDEEGSRFPASMLTSRAVAGTLDPAGLELADGNGMLLKTALAEAGFDPAHMCEAAYPKGSVRAYLEAHIEQGPVLEAEGLALGVVTAIAGQRRLSLTMTGTPGHAGTSAMSLRRDALTAAAEAVLAVERIARAGKPDLVATVGRLSVLPGATNVVPGRVEFTVDVRSGSDSDRDGAVDQILEETQAIAAGRGIALVVEETQSLAASPCDAALTDLLADAVAAAGHAPRRLVSGAGHDAMVMAALAPTAMLFIRCKGGISHNPAEDVLVEDAGHALAAMLAFIEQLAA